MEDKTTNINKTCLDFETGSGLNDCLPGGLQGYLTLKVISLLLLKKRSMAINFL